MEGILAGLFVLLLILVVVYIYFRQRARNQALEGMYGHVPSHVELYFKEYFEDIIGNWDLLDRDKAVEWSKGMDERLDNVTSQLESIKKGRIRIDRELDGIDARVEDMEKRWRSQGR